MGRDKLRLAGIPISRAQVTLADISDFDLGRTFDLMIAPYRVVQNLEADSQLDGLFRCVHAHLASGGSCVLNVFMPKRSPEELRQFWVTDEQTFRWEVAVEGGGASGATKDVVGYKSTDLFLPVVSVSAVAVVDEPPTDRVPVQCRLRFQRWFHQWEPNTQMPTESA